MFYDTFASPLGEIVISSDGKNLTGFRFLGQRYFESIPAGWIKDSKNPILNEAIKQTKEYFQNTRIKFDLPLAAEGTEFQKQVWRAVAETEYKKLTTYGAIASRIGRPKAVRAVGTAIGRNPLCIVVPCHRIVGTNGAMSGYAGGIDRKEKLLSLEGSL